MHDVVIENDAIRIGERFAVSFQRTLRIPDDGQAYPLPPGLGRFPLLRVNDYAERLPTRWREQGGVFIPMYQREALWLGFHGAHWKPNAVKIAVGGINAISGENQDPALHSDPQDYIVCPEQPWLDGIHTGAGRIRQFVAMPLGMGYTVEAAMNRPEISGGMQITVFEPRPGRFPDQPPVVSDRGPARAAMTRGGAGAMGLGAGGSIRQKIYPDPYGVDAWDQTRPTTIFVHIINSADFFEITGREPPPTPIDAKTYRRYRLPWFDLYDEAKGDVPPSGRFTQVKTVSQRDAELGRAAPADASIEVPESEIRRIEPKAPRMQGPLLCSSSARADISLLRG